MLTVNSGEVDVRDAPVVFTLPSRKGLGARVRTVYASGRTVVILSRRDAHLRRLLDELADLAPAHHGAFRIGDGRTATFLSAGEPKPFAYWPRAEDEGGLWVWACRACGAVDERWTWRDVDESSPMHREAVSFDGDDGPEMVEVPWTCPRSSACPGAPRWHRVGTVQTAAQLAPGRPVD